MINDNIILYIITTQKVIFLRLFIYLLKNKSVENIIIKNNLIKTSKSIYNNKIIF